MLKKKISPSSFIALLIIVVLAFPFWYIPDKAVLISSISSLIIGFIIVFYQVSSVFLEDKKVHVVEKGLIGLPGERDFEEKSKTKKKRKAIPVDKTLPGAKESIAAPVPEFEIDVTEIKTTLPFVPINEVELMRSMMESIKFWDDLSFYKIQDGVVYNSENVKMIGELYDSVFSGLATYFQRHKLTLDELLSEDTKVKEYDESFSSVTIGFIISLIEKEIASELKMTFDKNEVVIPKIKTKNPNIGKIVTAPEFKYQVLLLIRKYFEKQKYV